MHRSGTSAITRILNLLGADLTAETLEPASDNEKGFWESRQIIQLNDKILRVARSAYNDWRWINSDWMRHELDGEFRRVALEILNQDFKNSSFFVLKDPRICRLLPFWLEVFKEFETEPRIVIPLRNPLEVSKSLGSREGFSPARSHMIWLRHVLDAEYETRGLVRSFLTYDELLRDWRSTVARISDQLQLRWPKRSQGSEAEIDNFLELRLRHSSVNDAELLADVGVHAWVKATYSELVSLRLNPTSEPARQALDRVRDEFDRASDAFGAVCQAEIIAREELAESSAIRIGELERRAAEAETAREVAEAARETAEAAAASAVAEATEAARRANATETRARAGEAELSRTEAILHDYAKRYFDSPGRRWRSVTRRALKSFGSSLSPRARRTRRQLVRDAKLILESPLFDVAWYASRYPKLKGDRLDIALHYLKKSAIKKLNPSRSFDAAWYLERYPEVAAAGISPLVHYLRHGAAEGLETRAAPENQEDDAE
jgi:hypothetical protein